MLLENLPKSCLKPVQYTGPYQRDKGQGAATKKADAKRRGRLLSFALALYQRKEPAGARR